MDFESPDLQRRVDTQIQIDPKGETQKPLPTYLDQVSNAFGQERLTDNTNSDYNQIQEYYDTAIKDTNATDEEKGLISNYIKHGRSYDPMITELINNGELSFSDHRAVAHTDKAKKLLNIFMLPNFQIEGYSLAKKYGIDYSQTKPKIIAKTRKKYEDFEKSLSKDSFFTNFGSQFIGMSAGWLSDPANVATLATEIGALKLINPLFKMTKVGKAAIESERLGEFTKATQDLSGPVAKVLPSIQEGMQSAFTGAKATRLGIGSGVEMTANALGESYRQSQLYDFKHEVLPEYDMFDVAKNIGLVTVFGGMSGALTAHMENKMLQKSITDYTDSIKLSKPQSAGAGAEATGGNTRDKAKVEPKDATPLDTHIQNMDDTELSAQTQQIDKAFEDLQACAINNSKSDTGVSMRANREATMNAEGNGLIRGESSANKGEISAGDIARARTGEMSRYKDESIPGSRNKSTWNDLQRHLEIEGGFSKTESRNFVDHNYKKNGKQIKTILKDMGIDYEDLF